VSSAEDLIYFKQTPGSPADYFLLRADITEGLSQLFRYRLIAHTRKGAPVPKDWIGQPVVFCIAGGTEKIRQLSGQVKSFEVIHDDGGHVEFVVDVVPSLFTTQLSRNSRIFQKLDALAIIKKVLKDYPGIVIEDKIKGSFPKRDYCLQYRETDFDFVTRLMEEEGIFFYFQFGEGAGRYKHKLVLANDILAYFPGVPAKLNFQRANIGETVKDLTMNVSALTGKRTTRSYDYLVPPKNLEVVTPSKHDWADKGSENYDYPVWYTDIAEGKRRASLYMEGKEAWAVLLHGTTNYTEICAGGAHEIDDTQLKPSRKKIVIISVTHSFYDPTNDTGEPATHHCSFSAMPSDTLFRPQRTTPKPIIPGTQRAVVVGAAGKEIETDEHGRIKVQFMWDRDGKKDENSSCWMRVMQQWAGPGYGAQWIPRIGMEVLVSFLEGDPDQPIIIGTVYNGANKVPYELNGRETQSGWRTVSSKGAGKRQEFLFEDKAGSEEIYMYTGRNHRLVVDEDESIKIGKNQSSEIGAEQSLKVKSNQIVAVDGNQSTTVGGKHHVKVAGELQVKAASGMVSYGMANGSFDLKADVGINLAVGGNVISISQMGIKVNGIMVDLIASGINTIKGTMVLINSGGGGGGSASTNASTQAAKAVLDKLADRKMAGASGAWTKPRMLGANSFGGSAAKSPSSVQASPTKAPTPAQRKEIQDAISAGDNQKAIDLTVQYYGLDTKNAPSIKYDPAEKNYGVTSFDGSMELGNASFASDDVLASTITHELTHSNQAAAQRAAGATGWSDDYVDLDEAMAYDSELNSASATNLSRDEMALAMERRNQHLRNLTKEQREKYDQGVYP
jgi:type VI secretion system secreted protein VgrG